MFYATYHFFVYIDLECISHKHFQNTSLRFLLLQYQCKESLLDDLHCSDMDLSTSICHKCTLCQLLNCIPILGFENETDHKFNERNSDMFQKMFHYYLCCSPEDKRSPRNLVSSTVLYKQNYHIIFTVWYIETL